jgi:uncharacterized protein YndB with AHSA1/START domain
VRVEHEVVVGRQPEVVYAYMADPANLPHWQDGLVEVRREGEGPAAVGDRWVEIRTAMGKRLEASVELDEAEPGRRFTVVSAAGPIRFRVQHVLEPVDGGTRIAVLGEGKAGGVMKLAGGMVARQVRSGFESSFTRLKQILEGDAAG